MKLFVAILSLVAASAVAQTPQAQGSGSYYYGNGFYGPWSHDREHRKYDYAIVKGNPDGSINCFGSWDSEMFQKLMMRTKYGEEVLCVKKDGEYYVIKDAKSLQEVRRAFEPMQRVGDEMREVGRQYREVSMRRAAKARQRANDARQGVSGDDRWKVFDARMKEFSEAMEASRKEEEIFSKKMKALGEKMSDASRRGEEKVESVIDDAFSRGLAEKVDIR